MAGIKSSRGISLVELLVALGLAGMVITSAAMVYFAGIKAWDRSESQLEVQQNLRVAMNTLVNEIRRADVIEVYSSEEKIVLMFSDGSVRSYRFHPASKEIRLDESNSTVAMHIDSCDFEYGGGLISISITTREMEGVGGREYTFRINARGKMVYEY